MVTGLKISNLKFEIFGRRFRRADDTVEDMGGLFRIGSALPPGACQRNAKAQPKSEQSGFPWYPTFTPLWQAACGEAALPCCSEWNLTNLSVSAFNKTSSLDLADEQGTGNREQGTGNRDRRAESGDFWLVASGFWLLASGFCAGWRAGGLNPVLRYTARIRICGFGLWF